MNTNSASSFYDLISDFYDDMIRFEERLKSEYKILHAWSEKYRFKKVLDAGCGSGLHTIVLKQLGIDASGADISTNMISKARQNAQRIGQTVDFYELSFDQLDQLLPTQFDTVLILGNSLPHIKTTTELIHTLGIIHSILNDNGLLIIQMLNYKKILKNKERIVSIIRDHDREFIRFYDFLEPTLRFNVLSVLWNKNKPSHVLNSTELYPFTDIELKKTLEAQGFTIREQYGSMQFDQYLEEESKDCIIVAES